MKLLKNHLGQQQMWERLRSAMAVPPAMRQRGFANSHLREIQNFGTNPGALRMFTHLPPKQSGELPLVVVLHGCTQTAAGYDQGAGWSTLANRYGFALLFPEQQRANNPNGCFNWFQTGDIERGHGEALSIRQMIAKMVADHPIDARRVFVTGLSAGGAMTSVMLATYPDVFAGGAIIAGLPYGAAVNVQQAFASMAQSPPRSARAWGDLVRNASPHKGSWPRISVWHGSADSTVAPSNAREILKQWADLHGISIEPSFTENVDQFPRQVWRGVEGDEVIESYTIPNMAHGTPLEVGEDCDQCGAAGAFLLDVGISSSYRIAKFWGIADHQIVTTQAEGNLVPIPAVLNVVGMEDSQRERVSAFEPASTPDPSHFDIGTVITNALKAAGLMKSP
ncbi:MAG TPA: PHB depolymerase family esterase [Xanthobacteraceae bacterium]|nr:PHB depolymerase family esterase [Xanthobacteraceae bacterium]